MTAYVNDEQKKEGAYGKAVKATLAATLAAGMVPAAAAFADDAQVENTENTDAELLWNDCATDFAGGKVTKAVDQDGNELKVDEDGNIVVKAGSATAIYVQEYTTADGVKVELGEGAMDASKWEFVNWQDSNLSAAKTYKNVQVKVTDKASDYNNCTSAKFNVIVENGELEGVTLYNAANGNTDTEKTAFAYSAVKSSFALAKDGVKFEDAYVEGVYALSDINCAKNLKEQALDAGTYNVKVKGKNAFSGSTMFLKLTVDQFDISKSDLTVKDIKAGENQSIASPSGTVNPALIAKLSILSGDPVNGAGSYSATIGVTNSEADGKNIVGTKTVKYVVAGEMLADANVKYGADAWADAKAVKVDLSDETPVYFDANKVVVENQAGETLKQGKDYELVVTDKDGNAATLDDLKKVGSWLVYVKGIPGEKFAYAGMTETGLAVNVTAGVLTDANVSFYYNDEMKSSDFAVDYTGKNVLENAKVVVKDKNGKVLTEGTDYKVVVKKDGKEVAEAVDKGVYTVTVESDSYKLNATVTMNITVNAISATPVLANEQEVIVKGEKDKVPGTPNGTNDTADAVGVPYTGKAIVPEMKYETKEKDAAGEPIFAELPASAYEYVVTDAKGKVVSEIVNPDTYTVKVKDAKADDNWTVASKDVTLTVIDDKYFLDVPSTEWFYTSVNEAFENGWVKGYNASDFFGPFDSITRADVCVIVARMAGVQLGIDQENWGSETSFYETPFADVDGHMYYAQAIAWAANTGIVKGDGNTGNFRPNDEISRAEFAAIMMRYAQKAGDDTVVEDGALDAYVDADQVPAWFQGEVSWAVEAGIMGVGTDVINPNGEITRAEVAAMAVRL